MPLYRVLYLKDLAAVDRFRSLPPSDGPASIKPKDYIPAGEIEAPNEYAAWRSLQGDGAKERDLRPMGVGDVLENVPGKPRVCRYAGFDDAVWFVFEPRGKKAPAEAGAAPEVNVAEGVPVAQ